MRHTVCMIFIELTYLRIHWCNSHELTCYIPSIPQSDVCTVVILHECTWTEFISSSRFVGIQITTFAKPFCSHKDEWPQDNLHPTGVFVLCFICFRGMWRPRMCIRKCWHWTKAVLTQLRSSWKSRSSNSWWVLALISTKVTMWFVCLFM